MSLEQVEKVKSDSEGEGETEILEADINIFMELEKEGFEKRIQKINADLDKNDNSQASFRIKMLKEKLLEVRENYNRQFNRTSFLKMHNFLSDIEEKAEELQYKILKKAKKVGDVSTTSDEKGPDCSSISDSSSTCKEDHARPWQGLKRVSLPVFDGNVRNYDNWAASFQAMVDEAPIKDEEKLLHLRQYLSGEALQVIDGLGHSSAAYQVAKERLGRKYGGERRRCAIFLEEVDAFPVLRPNNPSDLNKLADLLDILAINLKESNLESELGAGLLYIKLQKKLGKNRLASFHRYLYEKKLPGTVMSLRKWILQENAFEVIADETTRGVLHRSVVGAEVFHNSENKKCIFCKESHNVKNCEKFLALSVEDRNERLSGLGCCFKCLALGHIKKECKARLVCDICQKGHHTLLHGLSYSFHFGSEVKFSISLRTIPIIIKYKDREIKVNCLLDDGSTTSFVNKEVVDFLGIPREDSQTMQVGVLNGSSKNFESSSVKFQVKNMNRNKTFSIQANTIDKVTGNLTPVDWTIESKKFSHLSKIPFHKPNNNKVALLIGLDHAELHRSFKEIKGRQFDPIARLTPLGWTCTGRTTDQSDLGNSVRFANSFFQSNKKEWQELDANLQRFWEIEEYPVKETKLGLKLSLEDKEMLKTVTDKIKFCDSENRYTVPIPWKKEFRSLPRNYSTALQRLQNTEKKLLKEGNLKEKYCDILKSYLEKGYIKKVDSDKVSQTKWFLPHFPVINMSKVTTKIRIVFDCAAKYKGVCLNDMIFQGPKLQAAIIPLLIRFRLRAIAFTCDIKEMYMQVKIEESAKCFHRFLWRDGNVKEKPDVYEFQRLVFGSTASPFLAQAVARVNAEGLSSKYPRAAETVLHSTYMDDALDSVDTLEEAKRMYVELRKVWEHAGMGTHKWVTNAVEFQKFICPETLENLDKKEDSPLSKTLGVTWNHVTDHLTFSPGQEDILSYTKRNFLRLMAKVFDPLGLIAPFVLKAKLIIQEIWMHKLDWDEEVPEEFKRPMDTWAQDLRSLNRFRIPRFLQVFQEGRPTLHVFTDASQEAYGAVVYLRSRDSRGLVNCNLVVAKSSVAPISALSVPRLELLAALKGCELVTIVCEAIKIDISEVVFWTDSLDVLGWIMNRSRVFKSFVADKLGKIHRCSRPDQWKYVDSKSNPAHLLTHPLTISELVDLKLWFVGPSFLSTEEMDWPIQPLVQSCQKELRKNMSSSLCCFSVCFEGRILCRKVDPCKARTFLVERLEAERYSSWLRFLRVRAWVFRFIKNSRGIEKKSGELNVDELYDSKMDVIRESQIESFQEYRLLLKGEPLQVNSKIAALNPFLDEEKIMRCNSRISQALYLPFETRYPVILPRNHMVSKLIVQHYHELCNHLGTNTTLASMSVKYWLICARSEINSCESRCYECKRRKAKSLSQLMAPLPSKRLQQSLRAFSYSGVDCAGPFLVKMGRGKTRQKRYICLFTCLNTRAVHLEVIYRMNTDSFLNAFWRFTHRRGIPLKVVSDNGKNFVSGEKEIADIFENSESQNQIKRESSAKGIEWSFNPPCTPHAGGVFEILIKAAKRAMKKQLENADINDEEFATVVTGAESLINSRPLSYQSAHPKDLTPLTPNHF